jgi:HK97 family phage portal protein
LDQFGNPFPEMQGATLKQPDQWLIDWFRDGGATTSGVSVNENSALHVSTFFDCVRAISNDIGKMPLFLYRRRRPKGKEFADDLPLFDLLHAFPNAEMSSFTFRQTLTKDMLLNGNGYAEIIRNAAGWPMEMWPLDRNCVTVLRDNNTQQLFYRYRPPGSYESYDLPETNVFHIRNIGDGLIGWSIVRLARESIGICLAQDKYNGAAMGNNSTPAGLLTFEGDLTDQALKRLREEYNSRHQGPENHGRVLVSSSGQGKISFTPFEFSPQDAEFILRVQHSVEEICRWFRMPPHKAGHLLRSTNNNIEQQNLEYWQDCLRDHITVWEQEILRKLVPAKLRSTVFAQFDLTDLLRADTVTRTAHINTLAQVGAIMPNEIRDLEGYNPYEGGDVAFINSTMIPVPIAIKGPQDKQPPADPKAPDNEDNEAENDEKPPQKGQKQPEKDASATVNKRLEAIVAAHEPLLVETVRRLLKTEQDKVTRAAKRSNFANWASGFYATQPRFISETLNNPILALCASLWAILGLDATDSDQAVIADELEAIGHRMVKRSKDEMREPTAVKGWSNGRADEETQQVLADIMRIINPFKETHEA